MADIPVNYNPTPTAPANTAASQGYQTAINDQLTQLTQPIDPNSAVVRSQTDPYRVSTERGLAQNRDALAEQAYAGGNLDSGDYGQQQQRAREAASVAEGTNTGNVMATAEAQRQAALGTDLGLGTNAALQQQGVTNQAGQFGDQLGLNYAQLATNQNQFGVTSAQNQAAINNALAIAKMNNELGYYNADTNYAATTRGQDITGAGAL